MKKFTNNPCGCAVISLIELRKGLWSTNKIWGENYPLPWQEMMQLIWDVSVHVPSVLSSGMTVWHKASSLKNSCTEGSSSLMASTRLLSWNLNLLSLSVLKEKSTQAVFWRCTDQYGRLLFDGLPPRTLMVFYAVEFSSITSVTSTLWPNSS